MWTEQMKEEIRKRGDNCKSTVGILPVQEIVIMGWNRENGMWKG